MQPYIIPFGVDPAQFFAGLQSIDKNIASVQENVAFANKSMRDGFTAAGVAADALNVKMKADVTSAQSLRSMAQSLGKEIGAALNVKGNPQSIQSFVTQFQNAIKQVQSSSTVNLGLNFSSAGIQQLITAAANGTEQLSVFNEVITQAKTNLATLTPGSDEFNSLNQQIQLSEGLLNGLSDAEQLADNSGKSLRAQLRGMKQDLAAMEIAGQGDTEAFRELESAAGSLQHQISATQARIQALASNTTVFDAGIQAVQGLTGAFAIAQGASGLLGDQNKDLQETLLKVTSAMAILQGLQQIGIALSKESALRVELENALEFLRAKYVQNTTVALAGETVALEGETIATEAATLATESFTAALLSNPISALIIALSALVGIVVTYEATIGKSTEAEIKNKEATEALKQAHDAAAGSIATELAKLEALTTTLDNSNTPYQLKIKSLTDLNTQYPEYLGNLTLEDIGTQSASTAIEHQIDLINKKAIAAAAEKIYSDVLTEQIKAEQGLADAKKNTFSAVQQGLQFNAEVANAQDKLTEAIAKTKGAEDVFKQTLDDVSISSHKTTEELQAMIAQVQLFASLTPGVAQAGALLIQKANAAISQNAIEDLKKTDDAAKVSADNRVLYTKQGSFAEISARQAAALATRNDELQNAENEIKDATLIAQKKDTINATYYRAVQDLDNARLQKIQANNVRALQAQQEVISNSLLIVNAGSVAELTLKEIQADKEAEITKAGIDRINSTSEQQRTDEQNADTKANNTKLALEKAFYEERAKTILDLNNQADEAQLAASKDSQQKDIQILENARDKEISDIREQYKNQADLADTVGNLITAINSKYKKQIQDTNNDYAAKTIDLQQSTAELTAENLSASAGYTLQSERKKQGDLLQIAITGAEARVALLKSEGKTEADQVLVDAEKALAKAKTDVAAFKDEPDNKGPQNFAELLGINLTPGQAKQFQNDINQIVSGTKQVTDAVVAGAQARITSINQEISAKDAQIQTLEGQLQTEQDLQNKGFANNVETLKSQIEADQKAKTQLQAQREEALKNEQEAQKIQLALDSITQISALVTASAKILVVSSSSGPIGVVLGLAAVAAMIAGFVAAKVSALNAINSETAAMGEGGLVQGPSHDNGGVSYRPINGRAPELEGGEHVTNKRSTRRALPLLESINSDEFWGLSNEGMRALLAETGIHLQGDELESGVKAGRQNESSKTALMMNHNFTVPELKSMDKSLSFLANSEKNKISQWEDNNFTYTKKGNKTSRTRKK